MSSPTSTTPIAIMAAITGTFRLMDDGFGIEVGVGVGLGVGVGVGEGVGEGVGVEVGNGVGVGVGDGLGEGVAVGVGVRVGVGDGEGDGVGVGDGEGVGAIGCITTRIIKLKATGLVRLAIEGPQNDLTPSVELSIKIPVVSSPVFSTAT